MNNKRKMKKNICPYFMGYVLMLMLFLRQGLLTIEFFFFSFEVLGLELRAFTLSHSISPIFVKDFFQDKVLLNYLPGLALNCNPPDLCS
jgi:hypothetical protein